MSELNERYRQARLVLQVPWTPQPRSYWSLHTISVARGVPRSRVLLDGTVGALPLVPTQEEIVEALDAAVRSMML